MLLFKNQNRQIRKNFTERELFSKSSNAPDSHFLNDHVVDGLQALRDYYGVPVRVNSTYRTPEHNNLVGGSPDSQHLKGNAIDLTFLDAASLEQAKQDLASQSGEAWHLIRRKGINGVGIYNGFIHIDARTESGLHNDQHGSYAFWDNRTGSKKKV